MCTSQEPFNSLEALLYEKHKVRFTPSQSNTGVAIAVETVGVAVVAFCNLCSPIVFGVMVMSTAGSGPSGYPV